MLRIRARATSLRTAATVVGSNDHPELMALLWAATNGVKGVWVGGGLPDWSEVDTSKAAHIAEAIQTVRITSTHWLFIILTLPPFSFRVPVLSATSRFQRSLQPGRRPATQLKPSATRLTRISGGLHLPMQLPGHRWQVLRCQPG